MHHKTPCQYRAYLLRCWREETETTDESLSWRFSVEEILQDRRRRGFDSLADLVAFLEEELMNQSLPADGASRQ